MIAPWFKSHEAVRGTGTGTGGTLMLKYRGTGLIKAGFIGAVLIGMLILVGLSPDRIVSLATDVRYQAMFSEAGGLATGNAVLCPESKSARCRMCRCTTAMLLSRSR